MTWALHTDLDLDTLNVRFVELQGAGLLGIAEEGGRATAYFPERVEGLDVPGRWAAVPDQDWHAAWRERLRPIEVGPFVIAAPWHASPGAGVLVVEPGQAFGTGHHETTTGCLAALCELDVRGRRVLDVGSGSGVLAFAAARLGAGEVVAVDVDPLAVEAARHGARHNGVRVTVVAGSVDDAPPGTYHVVLANLDTSTLTRLAAAIVDRLAPGGDLVASGISVERAGEAAGAFEAAGLPVLARRGREWVVLTGRRPASA